ncbi:hypothetical protein CR513_03238, partial [Mucuna pruriens]
MALLLEVEPNNIEEALLDDGWILAMQEELDQIDILAIATATWCKCVGKIYKFGWEKDYGGMAEVSVVGYKATHSVSHSTRSNLPKMLRSSLDEDEACQENMDSPTVSKRTSYMLKEMKTFHFDDWLLVPIKDSLVEDFRTLGIAITPIPHLILTFKLKYLNLQNRHPWEKLFQDYLHPPPQPQPKHPTSPTKQPPYTLNHEPKSYTSQVLTLYIPPPPLPQLGLAKQTKSIVKH